MPAGLTDAQLIERLQRLERSVERLAAHIGLPLDDPADGIDADIVELARAGSRIEAARLLSERTGTDFVEAQRVVGEL